MTHPVFTLRSLALVRIRSGQPATVNRQRPSRFFAADYWRAQHRYPRTLDLPIAKPSHSERAVADTAGEASVSSLSCLARRESDAAPGCYVGDHWLMGVTCVRAMAVVRRASGAAGVSRRCGRCRWIRWP